MADDDDRDRFDSDLGPGLSRRLAVVIREEMRHAGLGQDDLSPEVALLVQRVAMRSAQEATAGLAAELRQHGIEIELSASAVDETGADVAMPPDEPRET